MLMSQIPKMERPVVRPPQGPSNAVDEPHGFQVFRLEGYDRREHEPLRAADPERKPFVSRLVDVDHEAAGHEGVSILSSAHDLFPPRPPPPSRLGPRRSGR